MVLQNFRQLLLQLNVTPQSIQAIEAAGLSEPRKLKLLTGEQIMAHLSVSLPQAMGILAAAKLSP